MYFLISRICGGDFSRIHICGMILVEFILQQLFLRLTFFFKPILLLHWVLAALISQMQPPNSMCLLPMYYRLSLSLSMYI